jgi:hypothetical protein
MGAFDDRFMASTYESDEPVEIELDPTGIRATIPERLFRRIQHIAIAYELHLLPVVDVYTRTTFVKAQCPGLFDELTFIGTVIRDDLLLSQLAHFRDAVASCIRSPGEARLVIEGP